MATLTLYGSVVPDARLGNASDMAVSAGGVETSKQTTMTASGQTDLEILSQGGAGEGQLVQGPPTGKGWLFDPGPGTFDAGNWSAAFTMQLALSGATGTTTIRFYKYSGSYTAIGSITVATTTAAKTTYNFSATSMPSVTLAPGELLYIDLRYHDASSSANGDNPTVFLSTTTTAGVTNDLQVTTANFTPAPPQTLWHRPRYVMRGLMNSVFTPFQAIPAWVDRTLGSNFVRQTAPTNIPQYVRRSLSSLLMNFQLGMALRLRLGLVRDAVLRLILGVPPPPPGIPAPPTPLTLFPVHTTSKVITSANLLVDNGTGTTGSGIDTAVLGTATGWGEAVINGSAAAWPALTTVPAYPSGGGALLDVTYLWGQTIPAGNWSCTVRSRLQAGVGNATSDIYVRFWKFNPTGNTYTFIGQCTDLGITLLGGSSSTTFTFTAQPLPTVSFGIGEYLYYEVLYNVTANANSVTTATIRQDVATSTTVGETNAQFVTPGFVPTPSSPLWHKPRYIMRGMSGSIFTPFQYNPPTPWVNRAFGGNFQRPVSNINIPRYVRRGLSSLLLNYALNTVLRLRLGLVKDTALRFILAGGGGTNLKDIALRLRLGSLRDAVLRLRLGSLRDSALRFRLKSADQLRDLALRLRLGSLRDSALRLRLGKLNDALLRLRLKSANQLKDAALRLSLGSLRDSVLRLRLGILRDAALRLRLKSADQLRDIAIRLRLGSLRDTTLRIRLGKLKDVVLRFVLTAPRDSQLRLRLGKLNDSILRLRLKSADQLKDAALRLRLGSLRDSALRLRLGTLKDTALRLRLRSADQLRDLALRLRLGSLKDAVLRLRLGKIKDVQLRLILASVGQSIRDVALRFRLMSASLLKDTALRLRLGKLKDAALRLSLALRRDLAIRLKLALVRDLPLRLRLKSADFLKDLALRMRLGKARDTLLRLNLTSGAAIPPFGISSSVSPLLAFAETVQPRLSTGRTQASYYIPRALSATIVGKLHDGLQAWLSLIGVRSSTLPTSQISKQSLSFTHGVLPMPAPNTTIQSTITVTDINGALVSNASIVSMTVTFPDQSVTTVTMAGGGISNLGAGQYQAKYNTKSSGPTREVWSVTAVDGTTIGSAQFDIGVGY